MFKLKNLIIALIFMIVLTACAKESDPIKNTNNDDLNSKIEDIIATQQKNANIENPNHNIDYSKSKLKTIYLAGGCFWGIEAYMEKIYGVANAVGGYANGKTEKPSYQEVIHNDTGHAETVRLIMILAKYH